MSLFNVQPVNTGVKTVDVLINRIQNAIKTAFDTVEAIADGLNEPSVAVVSGDLAMSNETVVNYIGGGGGKITLPLANSIPGVRSRVRFIIGNGVGSTGFGVAQIFPGGSDLLNGGVRGFPLNPHALVTAISDGVSNWNLFSSFNVVTHDAKTIASGPGESLTFRPSGDTTHNTTARTLGYTLDFGSFNLPSNIVGLFISATERSLGTGSPQHRPLVISAGNPAGIKFTVDNSGNVVASGAVTAASLVVSTAATALGGGAAATPGTVGGAGPASAAQAVWIPIRAGGTTYFIPGWT